MYLKSNPDEGNGNISNPGSTTGDVSGYFSDSGQKLSGGSMDAALGDLDGDGDLDAFIANSGKNRVYLNDGEGHFTSSKQSGNYYSSSVALGDLDGDIKDLDGNCNKFQRTTKPGLAK
jgi:hypothetical protein